MTTEWDEVPNYGEEPDYNTCEYCGNFDSDNECLKHGPRKPNQKACADFILVDMTDGRNTWTDYRGQP